MFCIGLTGNVASGKSTVASLFADLGIEIISADHIAKQLTKSGEPLFNQIVTHFGKSIVNENGELNRRQLRSLIFNHSDKRQWLEQLLHPAIRKSITHNIEKITSPYAIIEIPLRPNKKDYPYLNRILFVKVNQDSQIKRLIARDGCNKKEALAILSSQAPEHKHLAIANDVIINDGSLAQLKKHVNRLHQYYLSQSQ